MSAHGQGFSTRAIHEGLGADPGTGAIAPPIVLSTVFERQDVGAPVPPGYSIYSRMGNPNRCSLEKALAALEGGSDAIAFSSGVAAITAVFMALAPGSRVLVPADLYMGTRLGLRALWQGRLDVVEVAMDDLAAVATELRRHPTALVWAETPSNPRLVVTDIAAVAALAHGEGALLAVDNSWASPVLQNPIALGADVVMHSTSKYISGHSDLIGGALVVAAGCPLGSRLRDVQIHGGGVPSPFDAWLARRGLMTLAVRMREHCRNARKLAAFLASHPAVAEVYYPGLETHPGHDVARRQMRDFGAMMSFRLRGGEQAARHLPDKMRLIYNTTSLGGVESLMEHRLTAEGSTSPTPPDLVRFSVGIEDVEDLQADLAQGLAAVS